MDDGTADGASVASGPENSHTNRTLVTATLIYGTQSEWLG